jgi:hypothetical protein
MKLVPPVACRQLAGGNHPRERRTHRSRGDREQLGEAKRRPTIEPRRRQAEQHRQHQRPGVERTHSEVDHEPEWYALQPLIDAF